MNKSVEMSGTERRKLGAIASTYCRVRAIPFERRPSPDPRYKDGVGHYPDEALTASYEILTSKVS